MFVPVEKRDCCYKDFILIYPAVSVGNVAQLTADLLISTLTMHRAGYIQHPSIIPLVGGDPFAHPEATNCKIVSCCEVYESQEHKVVIIQQRSPFVQGKRGLFRKWLVQWIKENQFSRVVIATSSSAEERLDTQLQGPQFRFVASPQIEKMFGDMFRNFYEWEELEKRQSFPAPSMLEAGEDQGGELYIPGGGVAKTLFEDLYEDVPTAICLMFCAEGDNVVEAVELANRLNRWLGLILFHSRSIGGADEEAVVKYTKWKIPVSWKLFYGSKFDQTLYH
ncbi:proteasome assembly chaperone 2-like [Mercenaria mercenaria]|uniref:proteasome assembly chaperone 2-like n=1 Tax=Mercenaria mercenaria TaxID=6596 RepID=UPI00234EE6D8|nr:proteasome assembly chaperone 2-like [Mercenaria mercenaria]